jgi:hypothetical protein
MREVTVLSVVLLYYDIVDNLYEELEDFGGNLRSGNYVIPRAVLRGEDYETARLPTG